MIITLVLYILIGGTIINMIYWFLATLLQGAIVLPFAGVVTRRVESGKTINGFIVFGGIITAIFSIIWAILATYIVFMAIIHSGSFGWHKWVFLITGFFLAEYHPGMRERDNSIQSTIATTAITVVYILLAIFLVKTEIPKYSMDVSNRSYFSNSLETWGESSDITNNAEKNSVPVSNEQTNKVISLISSSVENGSKVSDSYLDYLDPSLKDNYRNKFIAGEQIYAEGLKESTNNDTLESPSVQKQVQGNQLIKDWLDWWYKNNDRITNKAFN